MIPKAGDYIRFKKKYWIADTMREVIPGEMGEVLHISYNTNHFDTVDMNILLGLPNQADPRKKDIKSIVIVNFNWTIHQDIVETIPKTKAMEILYGNK